MDMASSLQKAGFAWIASTAVLASPARTSCHLGVRRSLSCGAPGGLKSLPMLQWFSIAGTIEGFLGSRCLRGKLRSKNQSYWRRGGGHWL